MLDRVDWNTRVVTGAGVAEITRPEAEDGGPMGIDALPGLPCGPG